MDSATLRDVLSRTDGSREAIQRSAGAMMRLYDTSAGVAVSEWRNALQTCEQSQLLPLLYVANEVLQNSKRNRGTKFLEAYSPVLGSSLIAMVQRDKSILEKVRRTAKIWGDRRVLSIRFVNELLQGLEPFRERARSDSPEVGNFSPEPEEKPASAPPPAADSARVTVSSQDVNESSDDDDDTEKESGFGDSLGHLDVSLDFLNPGAFKSSSQPTNKKRARRNSSMTGTSKRRKSILSTTSLMDLWNQVSSLQDGLDASNSLLKDISAPPSQSIDQLVGDELLTEYNQTIKAYNQVKEQQVELHKIASDRKALEQQAQRYIPWLQGSLQTDDDDVQFSRQLQEKIVLLTQIHKQAKQARDKKRQEEALLLEKQQEEQRIKAEEEDRKKFMESAMKKESEAKPGMVWSRERQEYVYLNTDESWRD